MNQKIMRAAAVLLLCTMLVCTFGACANAKNKKAIGTSGEYEIPYEQLRFITMTYKMDLDEKYGDGNAENGSIWDDPTTAEKYRAELEELVWDTVKENYALFAACANYHIGRDAFEGKEIKKAVDAKMTEVLAEYPNKRTYKNDLKERYATDDLFRFYFAMDEMKYLLHGAMQKDGAFFTDEATFEAWLTDGNSAYVQHFLLKHESDAEKEENRAILEDAREKLISGEWTLTDCINKANDDLTNVSPYYLMRNVHKDELVDAALSLKDVDDVSEIVEVEGALYVFVRVEETETENADGTYQTTLSLQLTNLLSTYQWAIVGDAVALAKESLQIELNDYGKSIDLVAMQ